MSRQTECQVRGQGALGREQAQYEAGRIWRGSDQAGECVGAVGRERDVVPCGVEEAVQAGRRTACTRPAVLRGQVVAADGDRDFVAGLEDGGVVPAAEDERSAGRMVDGLSGW
ncbi:hypothetical protein ACWGID_01050 [Kribbella sp. NPDC054772]